MLFVPWWKSGTQCIYLWHAENQLEIRILLWLQCDWYLLSWSNERITHCSGPSLKSDPKRLYIWSDFKMLINIITVPWLFRHSSTNSLFRLHWLALSKISLYLPLKSKVPNAFNLNLRKLWNILETTAKSKSLHLCSKLFEVHPNKLKIGSLYLTVSMNSKEEDCLIHTYTILLSNVQ